MNIFINIPLTDDQKVRIDKATKDETVTFAWEMDDKSKKELFLKAEVAFGPIPAEWLTETDNLHWLQLDSVGIAPYIKLDWDRLGQQITVTNLRGMFGVPVSETVIGGILSLKRGFIKLFELNQQKDWQCERQKGQIETLSGSTVLILGSGDIGLNIKKRLKCFECEVTVVGKTSAEADVKSMGELNTYLEKADVVVSCLPETEQTIGLFNHRRLSLIGPEGIFVNVGRGSAVDEDALVELLQSRELGGAVIDVTRTEPLPPDHPLWDCPNTLLTQHTGGGFAKEYDRKVDVFLKNLERYRKDAALQNIVNFKRGY